MDYPGRVIKLGEQDARILRALQAQLNQQLALGEAMAVELDGANPVFGPSMKQAVQLFQARNVDHLGQPLKPDGEVGAITWKALFGDATVPQIASTDEPLLAEALRQAQHQEARGVREVPPNSNRGPDVETYLKRTGLGGGHAWCCAFTYWCFDEAAKALQRSNPVVRTAGCMDHWNRAPGQGARRIQRHQAVADPGRLQPGMLFIMDFGGGLGHTGIVEAVDGGRIVTIEGNTDASKTREGGGVYRLERKLVDVSKGFIDYSGL